MKLRRIRRRSVARTLCRLAAAAELERGYVDVDDDIDFSEDARPLLRPGPCHACDGDGRDRWNDGITPCDLCGGDGWLW